MDEKDISYFTTVVNTYYETSESIRDTAIRLNLSRTKVRKILITMGVLESEITEQALELLQSGMSQQEAAKRLNLSVATLSTYLPYGNRVYNREEKSPTAVRVEACRARQYRAAKKQVKQSQTMEAGLRQEQSQQNMTDRKSVDEKKTQQQSCGEIQNEVKQWKGAERKVKETGKVISLADYMLMKEGEVILKGAISKEVGSKENSIKDGRKVFQLRMELENPEGPLMEEELAVLRKFGKVTNTLSRTILVPGEMTLNALHFAIQRSFGWENSHLHHFKYEEELFQKITGGKYGTWRPYCGVYFRFPYDTESDMDDIYWNDDYQPRQSFKNWLKKKYTGPYTYKGELEQYVYAQAQARVFAKENEILEVGPTFSEFLDGKKDRKKMPLSEVDTQRLMLYFECSLDELLERLTIEEVLGLQNQVQKAKKKVREQDDQFERLYTQWYKTPDSRKKEYSREHTPKALPLLDQILYDYDYGDGWRVRIICEEIYDCAGLESCPDLSEPEKERIMDVDRELKPVGVQVDGRNVMDDVGGIDGYCEFLKSVYDPDFDPEESKGPYTDKESSLEWASGMGWNGRISKPEKLL